MMTNLTKPVTQYLVNLIENHLREQRVVVWFDPERKYSQIATPDHFPQAQVYTYNPEEGFFRLRQQLEPLWGNFDPPCLLIYVPLSEADSHQALIEFTTATVVLQPGQQPLQRNTRLAVIARQALHGTLPPSALEKLIAEVEKGQITLDELDEIANRQKQAFPIGTLSLIFPSENLEEICLRLLTQTSYDEEIHNKQALPPLISILREELEIPLREEFDLTQVRQALGRAILLAELKSQIGKTVPAPLRTLEGPKSKAAIETALSIVRSWRMRSDYFESYQQAAQNLEVELGLAQYAWSIEELQDVETFAEIDRILQTLLENALAENPSLDLLELAQKRQKGFWASHSPERKLRWNLILEAGEVLFYTKGLQAALKSKRSATQWIHEYSESPSHVSQRKTPWCKLDTAFRRMERDEQRLAFLAEQSDSLQKLLARARLAYRNSVDTLTEHFIEAYEKVNFHLPDLLPQTEIFYRFVKPCAEKEKVAYVLVDSFRYEMALDFYEQSQGDFDMQLIPAIATYPTITEVGMAALLPQAEKGLAVFDAGSGKLGVRLENAILKSKPDRVLWLQSVYPQTLALDFNQLLPLKDKKINKQLEEARFAVVFAAEEIDGLWETQPTLARRYLDEFFQILKRGILVLFQCGYQQVWVTADHGFLAGEDLMMGTPMDPPGGETVDLHRRVWIGRGGAELPSCLRKPLSAFGLRGDLEAVTPRGLGCFKVPGGSTQYYHGGLSLQELIIPLLSIRSPKGIPSRPQEKAFHWNIKMGSQKISTRFFSIEISGYTQALFPEAPSLRVELRFGDRICSTPVAASYGLNERTKEIRLKFGETPHELVPNTVNLLIEEPLPETQTLDLFLIDANSGLALHQVSNIPLDIVI